MGTKRRPTEVVQAARGRLKGALQEVINVTEDEDENDTNLPSRGRPPKRIRKETTPPPPPPPQTSLHHSFIMKLFDRSVDLAKYQEDNALYPICRAWMQNQPRSTSITNYKNKTDSSPVERKPRKDLLDHIKTGNITDVTHLPAAEDVEITRVPSPLPYQKECSKDNIDLNYNLNNPKISRKELLADLKGKWIQVRKKWTEQSKLYEEKKFGANMEILEALYKK